MKFQTVSRRKASNFHLRSTLRQLKGTTSASSMGSRCVHAHGQRHGLRKTSGACVSPIAEKAMVHPGHRRGDAFTPRWPERDYRVIKQITADGASTVDLWEASPVRLETNDSRTEEVIDALFPGNPLLCCGWRRDSFETRPRKHWHKLRDLQFIVPNPMTTKEGITREGRLSAHSLSNTGRRRFLVIEFDFDRSDSVAEAQLLAQLNAEQRDESDLCASLLLHLAERAPLALVVHSGGKSLHGWFYCAGQSEESLRRFMSAAVSLGADHSTWTRSQFVRMPDGKRADGKRQTVYFFNPAVMK
jgi:hypothetical protein